MPMSPARACPCGGRITQGKCDRCDRGKRTPHTRTTSERGYDWQWQKFRARIVAERVLCEDCTEAGMVRAGEELHHLAKVIDRPDLRLDEGNVRLLCGPCHDKRTAKGE